MTKLFRGAVGAFDLASTEAVVRRCSNGVLRNFGKFTGKHLCQSPFFSKVAGLRFWHRCFPVNFAKFLRTPFSTEHLRWLLLPVLGDMLLIIQTSLQMFPRDISLCCKNSFQSCV